MKLGLAARGGGRVRVCKRPGTPRSNHHEVAVVRREPCSQRGKLDGSVGAPELPVIWAMCRAP